MIKREHLKYLQHILQEHVKQMVTINSVTALSGGSINNVYSLQCGNAAYFIKTNHADEYPEMFEREVEGLKALQLSGLHIPEIIWQGEVDDMSFLLMEFIQHGKRDKQFFSSLGAGIATLHNHTHSDFGWYNNNYIGSLPQQNLYIKDGVEFFISQRLQPMSVLAGSSTLNALLEKLYLKLPGLIPTEPPALIHGDLWNGNCIADQKGKPCIIDPAVYYGNREADIAMTKLFGGFDNTFYDSYNEVFPLAHNWKERTDLWNIYPLLVHVNLFGGGYMQQVESCIRKYI